MAFRIFRIHDDTTPRDKRLIEQVIHLTMRQFPEVKESLVRLMPKHMRDPVQKKLRAILFVASNELDDVLGLSLLYHSTEPDFCYLDYLAINPAMPGRGIGGALYDRLREECRRLKSKGLFFECLPDDPLLAPNPEIRKTNARRLHFYEKYNAFPIINTAYETPVKDGETDAPYLVYDPLDSHLPLKKNHFKSVVRAILERKYGYLCPETYIKKVITSIKDDPVQVRTPKYLKKNVASITKIPQHKISLIANIGHEIHHIRERGYVESPVRIGVILKKLLPTGIFESVKPTSFPEKHIRAVHNNDFVSYLKKACQNISTHKSIYPYVFPIRNRLKKPKDLAILSGYYCIDTFTPLNGNAFIAAAGAVNCALTGAELILQGKHFAYALVRPPGHHAESGAYGGFCYFNSNAIAANYLSQYGKVAILDIDYHHGNGQQDIFWERSDVLTVSIHGHPSFAYPYFTGFANEIGINAGKGYNLNLPLNETITADEYFKTLELAMKRITRFTPDYLVVALGLDTAKGDPTGTWPLTSTDFFELGKRIARIDLPTLIVQEGGYKTGTLGSNALAFFKGLVS